MKNDSQNRPKQPIRIDLEGVLRARMRRKVPRWIVRWLERVICQDELNAMLEYAFPRRGSAFCRAVLEHLDIKVNLVGEERLPSAENRRVTIVSNHPLGGLDGMALIDAVARRYGCEPLFVVNDLLMAVEPLGEVFVPINKHGSQSRAAVEAVDAAMAGDRPVLVFPAGLCSRLIGGRVQDLEWNKMFVQKSRQYGRTIVPLHFEARNSMKFYRTALWRKRLHIPFNLEMVLLPSEIFRSRGKTFTIVCGSAVEPSTLPAEARAAVAAVRSLSDALANDSSIKQP